MVPIMVYFIIIVSIKFLLTIYKELRQSNKQYAKKRERSVKTLRHFLSTPISRQKWTVNVNEEHTAVGFFLCNEFCDNFKYSGFFR